MLQLFDIICHFSKRLGKSICIIASLLTLISFAPAANAVDTHDSQLFISGFNAYQRGDYATTVDKMTQVLTKYPETPLRDMVLFWLARANYKNGNQLDAARYLSRFNREYPDSPLKTTVEEGLADLAARFDRGETLSSIAPPPAGDPAPQRPDEKAPEKRPVPAQTDRIRAEAGQQATAQGTGSRREAMETGAATPLPVERATAEQKTVEAEFAAKLAAAKADMERALAERTAAEKAAADKIAAARSTEESLREQLAAERTARTAAEAAKTTAERTAAEQIAAARTDAERQATERLAREHAAKRRAEEDERLSAQKRLESALAAEKTAREQAEAEKAAMEKSASIRLAEAKAELDRREEEQRAALKAAQTTLDGALAAERAARQKAESERLEAERRIAELKAPQPDRTAAPSAAAPAVAPAPPKAAKRPQTAAKTPRPKAKGGDKLREKAVAEYKRIIDRFPGSRAAASAAAKLRELGIRYGAGATEPQGSTMTSTARVLAFEVGQYASLDLVTQGAPTVAESGTTVRIPFELVNSGNGPDTFTLSTSAPGEMNALFTAADSSAPLSLTPPLAPGERFKGAVTATIPGKAMDGERITFPIRAASQFTPDVSQSRELRIVSSAPLLRAVMKADRSQMLPGGTVSYRISLLNVGSAPGRDLSFRLSYPAQLVPTAETAGMGTEIGTLTLGPFTLQSGESRDISANFRLAADALAQQELFVQGEISNPALQKRDSFLAQAVTVQTVRGVTAGTAATRLSAIPGQKVLIPVVITNTGNIREDFSISPTVPAPLTYALYQDLNHDGLKQAGEPLINHVGPLSPREVAHLLLELTTDPRAADGSSLPVGISFVSDTDRKQTAGVNLSLVHTRPVLDLSVDGKGGKLRPGETSTVVLDCVNHGSSLAKIVELESIIPEQMELVAADPMFTRGSGGRYLWTFEELGSGERRSIKVTYRIKSGTALGTSIQLQNLLSYQDLLGNRY